MKKLFDEIDELESKRDYIENRLPEVYREIGDKLIAHFNFDYEADTFYAEIYERIMLGIYKNDEIILEIDLLVLNFYPIESYDKNYFTKEQIKEIVDYLRKVSR